MVFEKILQKKSHTPDPNFIVGLDIGTEYVKALIAHLQGDQIEIIGVGRAHQELGDMHQGAIADIAGVVKTARKRLRKLRSKQASRRSAVSSESPVSSSRV